MQRKLRRLPHGSDEQERCDGSGPADFQPRPEREGDGIPGGSSEEILELKCTVELVRKNNPGKKRGIGNSEECKGLECSPERRCMRMVVRQDIEQIAQDLPEQKQHHEIRTGDHAE